ncbi:MAG TPA: helix-turn-helix transcriptional regulator, partial [Ktedonobacterales bacterium]|nr:helix-turn-helix transcriptional regulator [Ktedonobacterales bacterium]
MNDEQFGDRLRQIRKLHYLEAGAVAAALGIQPQAYRRWERGDCAVPRARLEALAAALEICPDYMRGPGCGHHDRRDREHDLVGF